LSVKRAKNDKKRQGGNITLVLPHAIGDCRLQAIPVEELATLIKAGL
jgi:3-dehydroquinate synthetase